MNTSALINKNEETVERLKNIKFNLKNKKMLEKFQQNIKNLINIINLNVLNLKEENVVANFAEMLNIFSQQYYYSSEPYVSDEDFDFMLDLLEEIEHQTKFVYINSPTKRVGIENLNNKGVQYEHIKRMYSLSKYKTIKEAENFYNDRKLKFQSINLESNEFSLLGMPKYDGMSIELLYQDGKLINALLRGNGINGISKLNQAKLSIKNIPFFVKEKSNFSVVGECLMPYSFFEKVKDIYSNPRNAASGIINNDNYDFVSRMGLKFIAYGSSLENKFNRFSEMFEYLKSLSFETAYFEKYTSKEEMIKGINDFENIRSRSKNPNDGFVILIDDIKFYNSSGSTNEKYPNASFAFKYEDEIYKTKLIDIVYDVGRTGKITPVAVIEPTEIDGSIITRATLNNFDFIKELEISKGCIVNIKKANEVIPKIVDVKEKTNENYEAPLLCPYCGSRLQAKENSDGSISKDIFCLNEDCDGKNAKNIVHFCKIMGIKNISTKTLDDMKKVGLISYPFDLYKLNKEKLFELNQLSGYGDKKIDNIYNSINKSRCISLDKFINSLNIPNIGESISRDIEKIVKTYDNFVELTEKEIEKMKLPDSIKTSLINFFNEIDKNIQVCSYLFEAASTYGLNIVGFVNNTNSLEKDTNEDNNGFSIFDKFLNKFISDFQGKNIVVTGTAIYNRNFIKNFCDKYRIGFQSSVNARTNAVFCEDDDFKHLTEIKNGIRKGSTKLKKAIDYGVNIYSYIELEKALSGEYKNYTESEFCSLKGITSL